MSRQVYYDMNGNEIPVSAVSYSEKPFQSNADKIRAMTDEELAQFLEPDGFKPWYRCKDCRFDSCVDCCYEWLTQEAVQ